MPGDEDHIVMDRETFAVSRTSGAFCLAWEAHGLGYGVPHNVLDSVSAGRIVVVNASRRVVTDAEALGVPIAVAHVTASAEKIAQRLSARGREDHAEIAARLARNAPLLVKTARLLEIRNDRAIAAGVTALVDALRCISQQDHSAV
jgi:phosphonate metabolism protein PhnN/1,5-bisphosphokinase (PRPP-forming)